MRHSTRRSRKIRVYLANKNVADPYTILIDKSIYGMGEHPNSINGFNQYSGELDRGWLAADLEKQFGKKIPANKVPNEIKKAILQRAKSR